MKTVAFAASLALCTLPAWAALDGAPQPGGKVASLATSSGAAFVRHTHDLASGTAVHEYADPAGRVFALAWSGPFQPDLRTYLGTHFAAFEKVAASGQISATQIRQPGLVIQSAGRMGAFQGRAWVPGRLPAGFDPGAMP